MVKGCSVAVATIVIMGTVMGSSYAVEVLDTRNVRRPQVSWYLSHPSSVCRLIKDRLEPLIVCRLMKDQLEPMLVLLAISQMRFANARSP